MGINVRCEVPIFERDGLTLPVVPTESISVHSVPLFPDRVKLLVGDSTVVLRGQDIIAAIANAMRT